MNGSSEFARSPLASSGGVEGARFEQMRIVSVDDLTNAPFEQAQVQLLQVGPTAVEINRRKQRFDHVSSHVPCGFMQRVRIEVEQLMELMLVADLGETLVHEQKPFELCEMMGLDARKHRDQHPHLHTLEGAVAETLQRLVAAGRAVGYGPMAQGGDEPVAISEAIAEPRFDEPNPFVGPIPAHLMPPVMVRALVRVLLHPCAGLRLRGLGVGTPHSLGTPLWGAALMVRIAGVMVVAGFLTPAAAGTLGPT